MEEEIKKILDEMLRVFRSKNSDYGNSFEEVRNELKPYPVILVRLSDKFKRVKTLLLKSYLAREREELLWINKGLEVKIRPTSNSETIEDTLLDLANYCVMELAVRRLEKK